MVGKKVHIHESWYTTATGDARAYELVYEGQVDEVDNHMMKVVDCHLVRRPFQEVSKNEPKETRWFNTAASTFKSILEL